MDELLAGEAERPERQTGDDIFGSDARGLLGSLLKFKEEAAVEGGGRYATIRVHQGHRQATHGFEQGGSELKVSLAGDGTAANIRWMGRQELDQKVEAAVVGVLADSKRTGASKGRSAGGEGEAVLSAVGKDGGVEELCAVQMVNGQEIERVAAVETAVVEFGLVWLPWRSGRAAAPGYRDAPSLTSSPPH